MTAFLIIGGVGVALVLLALLVGDVLDGVFDVDVLGGDLFSMTSIAAFVGAFGFGGALGLAIFGNPVPAVIVGLIVGALAAWGAIALTRALKRGENAATFRSDSMIGYSGRVITAIPAVGYGEIRISVGGHVRKLSARSALPVDAGQEVWVSAILSPTAVEVTPTTPELTS
ncbi:hypothetical protein SAMN02745244_01385 [Tessaracoccus bendigoensis DSM 12906]|uniref:NfeD-like C-terminal, partner-binding n=1 Tax=Tessaracoccus bendigoensis DSM 12906 TaxID=1123357 RepID=A0A1M6F935_9ACTN|nr:hypothetical protein [Tessaracoccus bendigoensis]SHI94185.1 hypothetical protein SAMN02745244_01385 [Tessaracoccus bendigoensis DSM 12906]